MAYKVVARVSKAGGSFSTVEEAIADWKASVAAKEAESGATIKQSVAGVDSIQRTVTLLDDASGFEIVDVYASEEIHALRMTNVKKSYGDAGVAAGEGVGGWLRTLVSAETVEAAE